jgi:hypothetical protein
MPFAAALIPLHSLSRIFIFSSSVITVQLFFASLSLLRLHFYSIMLSKGNIINIKIRENGMTQINTVTVWDDSWAEHLHS